MWPKVKIDSLHVRMADELSIALSISETKNSVTTARSFTDSFDVSGTPLISAVQNIGTSDETLSLGDVTSLGYIFLRNVDATNYVEIGYTSGTYFGKLKPSEFAVLRAGAGLTAIHAKANTAAINLDYVVFSD
jgi:hypothetical protein